MESTNEKLKKPCGISEYILHICREHGHLNLERESERFEEV